MKRTAILLSVSFFVFAVTGMAQAQIRIAHYDFENNTTRATFETTVKRQVSAGNSTLVKVGEPTTISKAAGAGMALHGATSAGSAASAASWSAAGSDPVKNATTYYQFTIDTSGFTGASLSFDVLSGTTSANHPHIGALVSTDGGKSYSPLIAGFDPGNNSWLTQSVNLPAAADNNSILVIRIYGYHSDGTSEGLIAIDNITVSASSTLDSATTKDSLNEIDVSTVHENARSVARDIQTASRMISKPPTREESIPLRSLGLPAMTGRFFSSLFADKTISNGRITDKSSETRLTSRLRTTETPGAAQQGATPTASQIATPQAEKVEGQPLVSLTPTEGRLVKANSFDGDLRDLPYVKPVVQERPEHEPPDTVPVVYGSSKSATTAAPGSATPATPAPSVQAPAPIITFAGLDFATFGAGHPPDTNGDVGPSHYIQAVNTSIGIYNKSGTRLTAFSFNTFMSQGSFGNLCDTNNGGDPVVLYDSFEDRWIITDLAFQLDGSNNVINPPGAFQCIAVSKTSDPVSGGWNFYSINTTGGLGDYPKFGIWPDGLYMSANMFGYPAGAAFQNPRLYAFNKAQMYAGSPTVQTVSFDAPSTEFTLLPANARLQTGTPPAGSPNYYAVVAQFLNAESIYKFHVDWDRISTSTFTGPFISSDTNWWEQLAAANQTAPTPANRNDELYPRLMMQNQYTNIGGIESLWTSHTVGSGNPGAVNLTATQAAVRYYQVKVTGGTVEAAPTQAWTHSPDASLWRYMPSVAVDRAGDMAIGYTTSNATTNPALQYAGRLTGDPVNSITQTERLLFQGAGAQSGNCGGTCTRWGDYSAMTLDPDGCTFWYTNEYYATNGLNNLTRIGSFKYPSCTSVGGGGTVSGTVTDAGNSSPISGATVALGARTTTTNGSGVYSFTSIPAGTYPSITASFAGYGSSTATTIAVSDSATTTRNFALSAAATSACPVDTSQADFQTGVPANTDLTTSAGNVTLTNPGAVEQQSTTLSGSGFAMNTTSWFGQTFTAGVSGPLIRADINLFCSGCTGTSPNLTLSVRATSGGLPTGADLASATLTGNASGASSYFTGTFASPPNLTSGTVYALIIRPVSNPSAGTYAITKAFATTGNAYSGGTMVNSGDSGVSWGPQTNDAGFHTYINAYVTSGTLISTVKDANPATGFTANWTSIAWTNPALPSGTSLKFQAAASNNVNGPFNFVGPDGTASTFFTTSGASLSQFNGFRYLKYEALLATSNTANTPTLNDVTICYTSNNLVYGANGNLPAGTYNNITINSPSIVTETGNVTVNGCVTINSGGTLNTGTSIMSGPGCFTLNSGGTLGIGSPNGITSGTTASGNIQVTGGRSYSTGANYTYNGSAAQVTGNGLPAIVNNFTLSNSAGLTLSATETVNGVLDLGSGDINTTASFAILQNGTSAATATGDVVGSVQRTDLNVAGTHPFGNPNVQIAKTGGTASTVTITLVKGATSLNIPSAVKREYNVNLGALTMAGSLRLHYLDTELGTTAENTATFPNCNLRLWRKDTTTNVWSPQGSTACDASNNWVELSAVPGFSPWAIAGAGAPTACKLESFNASRSNNDVVLEWHTGLEVDNIGFNVYREGSDGKQVRLTPHLVAGSALMVRRGTMLTAGLGYSWTDPDTKAGDSPRYWLEDLDISGQSTWSGPFWIDENRKPGRSLSPLALQSPTTNTVNTVNSPMINAVNAVNAQQLAATAGGQDAQYQATGQAELKAATVKPTGAPLIQQINLAGQPAVKISVRQEGYYRVTQPDLLAAGLDPSVDPRKLQLYVDGVQIPMIVQGENDGNFGPQDSIEFYGLGLDTASTDTHVYWLITGAQPGSRIKPFKGASGAGSADSFSYTVQRKDRLYYFSNIPNGDKENFFGAFIYYQPTDQSLFVNHIAPAATATLEIAMQGFNVGKHHVAVSVNGALVGNLDFNDQSYSVSTLAFSQSLLTEGTNTITMVAQAGNSDFSFVDYMKLTYSHSYNADANALKFTAGPSRSVTVNGFSDPAIRVMDVTDPASPQEMLGRVSQTPQGYSVTTGTTGGTATRTLMVFLDSQARQAAKVAANRVSNLRQASNTADLVMVSYADFASSLESLKSLRVSQGLETQLVDIEDVYDEFNGGNKSPQALKDFLSYARTNWKKAPKYVLLAGTASFDPRNYLNVGATDFVPTMFVQTQRIETASDDAFADFNNDGIPEMAVGRLPARTADEAARMVQKVINYDQAQASGSGVLLVADVNNGFDFEANNDQLTSLVPKGTPVQDIRRGSDPQAKQNLLDALNLGKKLVNYTGHGSVDIWEANLLTDADAATLVNAQKLSVVVAMTCLNGYFIDERIESLAHALLNSPNGAVAMWSSSGLTMPDAQTAAVFELFRQLFAGTSIRLGDATIRAKAAVNDIDVRRTWILIGDPTTRFKQ